MRKDCANCEHLGRDCPKKLMLLPLDELIDWCLHIMKQYRITHEGLAKLSGVPKGTIDRVLAKQSADCKYSTIHTIVCTLFECMGVSSVCLDDVTAEEVVRTDALAMQNAELQAALDSSEKERRALQSRVEDFVESRSLMKEQIVKKDASIDSLTTTINDQRRAIKFLAALLGGALLVIIAALLADKLNPNMGFFWR